MNLSPIMMSFHILLLQYLNDTVSTLFCSFERNNGGAMADKLEKDKSLKRKWVKPELIKLDGRDADGKPYIGATYEFNYSIGPS